jgi:PUA-domain protein
MIKRDSMASIIVKKRHTIRKSQTTSLYGRLQEQIGSSASLFQSDRVEKVETNTGLVLYLIDKKPLLMEYEDWIFPTLRGAVDRPFPERRMTIDSGAVSFMINGADVMRPGITGVTDDVREGCPVLVVEEKYGKPLVVAIALKDAADIRGQEKGKSARNIHFVGDDIWNIEI